MTFDCFEILNPNNWDWSERTYTIWTPRFEYGFQVDYDDYCVFTRWLWDRKVLRRGGNLNRKKIVYCCRKRNTTVNGVPFSPSVYLHIEIMKRSGVAPPTPDHVLVDHIDGDTFNCRKANLQWATYEMNRIRGDKRGKGITFAR